MYTAHLSRRVRVRCTAPDLGVYAVYVTSWCTLSRECFGHNINRSTGCQQVRAEIPRESKADNHVLHFKVATMGVAVDSSQRPGCRVVVDAVLQAAFSSKRGT